jgi:lipoprotein-anchoring transpeptidase ErfK/SrfK
VKRGLRAAFVIGVVAAGAIAATRSRGGEAPPRPSPAATAAKLPASPLAAFAVGAPVPFRRDRYATTWAAVRRNVLARVAPVRGAKASASIHARTPEGTTNVVLPLARKRLWVKLKEGWVPRSALGAYGTVRTRLIVDLARETATLLRDGRAIMRAPVGVGAPHAPTPTGEFVIRERVTRYHSAFYGPIALGTSAQTKLTDWPGGGFVGIHGTDAPQLIPGRISHGCIRMRNADIVRLARLAPVGTPLTIRA